MGLAELSFDEQLDQEIYDEGIALRYEDLSEFDLNGHYYFANAMKCPVISLEHSIKDRHLLNYLKAHELGHHHNCICNLFDAPKWIQQRYETLADRDWVENIFSPEKIVKAYLEGVGSPFELAEYLEIPIDAVLTGLKICFQIHGYMDTILGQYVICWNPLSVRIDRRRKRFDDVNNFDWMEE